MYPLFPKKILEKFFGKFGLFCLLLMTMKNKTSILEDDIIIEKYNEIGSISKTSKFLGITNYKIKQVLKSNNIDYQQRTYTLNEEYFDNIDSEEKAYWLGFLYADGNVRLRNGKGGNLGLKLSTKDLEHLTKLKNCLNSTHKIKFFKSTTKDKKGKEFHSYCCALYVFSNYLVKALIKQGCVEKKTFILDKPPIDEIYYRHFIRGYFDGDGCFYIKKRLGVKKTFIVRYDIACASEKLKDFMIEELNKNSIDFYKIDNLSLKSRTLKDVYNFYDYIYDGATIFLERKKDKASEFRVFYEKKRKEGVYCFQDDYINRDRNWNDDDISLIKSYVNKIPLSYLHHSILPHKNKQQIARLCMKLGINNDNKLSKKDYEDYCLKNNIQPYLDKVVYPLIHKKNFLENF